MFKVNGKDFYTTSTWEQLQSHLGRFYPIEVIDENTFISKDYFGMKNTYTR